VWFLNRRNTTIAAAFAAAIVACAAPILWLQTHNSPLLQPISGIGGPFSLVDHHGRPFTEQNLVGKPTLLYFGFTYCPDVCPTTLFELTKRLEELGSEADRLNIVFITVDPERDTPQQLALYLSSFDPHIVGLSGSEEQVAVAVKTYRAFARKVPLSDGGYTMDHTATIYMLNKRGQFVGVMSHQDSEATMRTKLRRLLDDAAAG